MISSAAPPFLASLYEMLSKEDPRVIGWCDGGKAFGVHNFDAMEKHMLPTYFRHSKFASFQRQLNYFGFRKVQTPSASSNKHSNIYYQPLFTRDDPSAMLLIKRKTYGLKIVPTPRRTTTPEYYSFPATPITPPSSSRMAPVISRSSSTPNQNARSSAGAPMLRRSHSTPVPDPVDFDAYLSVVSAQPSSYEQLLYGDIPRITPQNDTGLFINASMAEAFPTIQDVPSTPASMTSMVAHMQTVSVVDAPLDDFVFAPLPFRPLESAGDQYLSNEDLDLLACFT
ncbi:hypothetical protein DYB36_014341 [Aphanomyces astaci]|uniref:HSF-type DNA-binding domain-containing protein n=1 Tax=Aphanomyces astaci TaxID=112090 RepID=A0A396ZVC4_APHAT|nr:hypothetical protein DYB36_014341 [Aphanomyces astaci]